MFYGKNELKWNLFQQSLNLFGMCLYYRMLGFKAQKTPCFLWLLDVKTSLTDRVGKARAEKHRLVLHLSWRLRNKRRFLHIWKLL